MKKVTREYTLDILRNHRSVTSLDEIPELSTWDVSEITDFSMFFNCNKTLKDIKALSHWNVSKGSGFYFMFHSYNVLDNLLELVNWTVPKNLDVNYMFGVNRYPREPQIEWLNKNIKRHD